MPEPFKNLFNAHVIDAMAEHLGRVHPPFDVGGFATEAQHGLEDLELKARAAQITDALERYLPDDFPQAVAVLTGSLDPVTDAPVDALQSGATDRGIRGWAVMPMADYVARRGLGDVPLSLDALKAMTMRFSSEFAIRPFLIHHPQDTLRALTAWRTHENEHVRRLVSEGSRPRLPWGIQLKAFIRDPAPVLDLLEGLKDDASEYVRRSVANNLNDISKDHADVAAATARSWMKDADQNRERLVRHAMRTLIKAGHADALKALGYGKPKVRLERFSLSSAGIALGETLAFDVEIASAAKSAQPLILDYAIHHVRANGKTSPKVFKWKSLELPGGETFSANKRHTIKPVTTRRYYAGTHSVEILVNGQSLGRKDFELKLT